MFSSLLDLGLLGDLFSSFDEDIPGRYNVTFSYSLVCGCLLRSVFLICWCVRIYRLKTHSGKQINDVGSAKIYFAFALCVFILIDHVYIEIRIPVCGQ